MYSQSELDHISDGMLSSRKSASRLAALLIPIVALVAIALSMLGGVANFGGTTEASLLGGDLLGGEGQSDVVTTVADFRLAGPNGQTFYGEGSCNGDFAKGDLYIIRSLPGSSRIYEPEFYGSFEGQVTPPWKLECKTFTFKY